MPKLLTQPPDGERRAMRRPVRACLAKALRRVVRGAARDAFEPVCLAVEARLPVRFVCPARAQVACVSGTAWITTDDDLRDVVLEAGQAHRAARGDRLFINGMPACALRIEPA